AKPHEVIKRTEALLADLKDVQREKESLVAKLANIEAGSILDDVKDVNGVKVLAHEVAGADMNTLRNMADDLKQKIESGLIVLASSQGEKVNLIAAVTKDLISEGYHAGKLIKEVASICGGGGGGRPDMAQAGGEQPEKINKALNIVEECVKSI